MAVMAHRPVLRLFRIGEHNECGLDGAVRTVGMLRLVLRKQAVSLQSARACGGDGTEKFLRRGGCDEEVMVRFGAS